MVGVIVELTVVKCGAALTPPPLSLAVHSSVVSPELEGHGGLYPAVISSSPPASTPLVQGRLCLRSVLPSSHLRSLGQLLSGQVVRSPPRPPFPHRVCIAVVSESGLVFGGCWRQCSPPPFPQARPFVRCGPASASLSLQGAPVRPAALSGADRSLFAATPPPPGGSSARSNSSRGGSCGMLLPLWVAPAALEWPQAAFPWCHRLWS